VELMRGKLKQLHFVFPESISYFTDDSDARDVGELYDIEVHGTAGIVARAYSLGLLSYEETRRVMHDLHERSSLYMTERVYRIVMDMIEKG